MKNSGAMEKEGLERTLTFLTEEGPSIDTLITDRRIIILQVLCLKCSLEVIMFRGMVAPDRKLS